MSIKTIPEKKIVTCDSCGADNQRLGVLFDKQVVMQFTGNPVLGLLDQMASAMAGEINEQHRGVIRLDLCDSCFEAIRDEINRVIQDIRADLPEEEAGRRVPWRGKQKLEDPLLVLEPTPISRLKAN